MRRVTEIVFAILGAYLVLSMAPMAAAASSSEELVVGSAHQDFGTGDEPSPAQTENITIEGSGDSASAVLQAGSTSTTNVDGFEDGDIAEYGGDTGAFSATTTSEGGTYGLKASTSTNHHVMTDTGVTVSQGHTITYYTQFSGSNWDTGFAFGVQSETGNSNLDAYRVDFTDTDVYLYETSSGSDYTLDSQAVSAPTGEWVKVTIEWKNDGTISVTVTNASGNTIATLSATDTTYTSGGIGFRVYDGTTYYDTVTTTTVTEGHDRGVYISANHSVTNASQAKFDLTLTNASAIVTVQEWTGSAWQDVASGTYTSSANHSLNISGSSYEKLRANVTFINQSDNGEPTAELHDESILYTNHAPTADNSTATPSSSSTNNENVDLSIDISDQEFGTVQGDNVTVTAFVDGSSIGSKTISSNQTVTFTANGLSDGSHSWHVELEDGYGLTSTSDTFSFTVNHYAATTSDLSPNGTSFNDETVTVSGQVNDTDFAESSGDSVTVELFVDGASTGKTKTISSNQTVSFDVAGLSDGEHTWHLETVDEYGLTSTSSTASFTVNHYAPVLDNSSADPQSDAKQSSRDVNLSIPLEDVDFAEGSGDEAAVEFYVDGKLRDTVNVTSNGTVSTTVTVSEGGNHTWHVRATDEYGQTTTSDTFGFQVPSELSVYKETKPSQLVDNVPVEIQFYFEGEDDLIVTRNATNGTINMTGLPVDQSFVVVAQDDSGDYYDRRIFVESLFKSQSIYLLNKSEAAVTQRFELQDYSGDYPKEKSVLLVQRSINDTWQTVEGDRFGATGEFPTTLAKDQRHRLIVLNVETGKREEIGHITPTSDSLKTVKITSDQSIVLEPVEPVVLFGPSTNSVPAIANASIQGEIRNKSATFDSWSIEVIVENTTSGTNTTLYNNTFSSPGGGTDSAKVDLRNRTNHTLYVVMSFTTTDGRIGNVTKVYQIDEHFANEYSALSVADKISKQIDPGSREGIKTFIAVIITALLTTGSAASMGMSPELSGLTATASLAAFGVIGWVPYSLVTAAVITMLAFGGLRRGL